MVDEDETSSVPVRQSTISLTPIQSLFDFTGIPDLQSTALMKNLSCTKCWIWMPMENMLMWMRILVGLFPIHIYGYGHIVYNCKPYKKWALLIWLWVTKSILYGHIMDDMRCIVS